MPIRINTEDILLWEYVTLMEEVLSSHDTPTIEELIENIATNSVTCTFIGDDEEEPDDSTGQTGLAGPPGVTGPSGIMGWVEDEEEEEHESPLKDIALKYTEDNINC